MKHIEKSTSHNKNEFQLERIAFFTDAVFAIAITLLVIEIRVPEIHGAFNDKDLLQYLAQTTPKFIGVIVSFFVIGLYWIAHHKLFGFILTYNRRLLWLNLGFMMTIIFMPFSTAFLSEYYNPELQVPLAVYTININLTGLMSYRLWKISTSQKLGISSISNKPIVRRYYLLRALIIPLIFLIVLCLSFFSGWIPFLVLPFMPMVSFFIKRRFSKKHPTLAEEYF